ncbi:hypothetical protein IU485_27750 [Nocardia cyriacigeorgica]|uniref:hypothetical protein n=1 Tax=Nocardia cyriacigeorgica TaxID=135487 RepID=UPI001895A00D|nr:hypothetical protein [Nocardia cyriacigeorgica]MBF6085172.1 hypothetical protein [Nocardia cyriacigeorgica]
MSYTIDDLHRALVKWGNAHPEREGEWDDEDDPIDDEPDNNAWHLILEALESGEKKIDLPDIGTLHLAESFGGEGEGDRYWFAFSITDANGQQRWFRRDGWYASHYGGEYEGPTTEVHPVQTIITVYQELKK